MKLEIKVHNLFVLNGEQPLKAFADLNINDAIIVKGLKVIEGKQGLLVSMPYEQGKDSKWYESVRALDKETREQIQSVVLEAYNNREVNV